MLPPHQCTQSLKNAFIFYGFRSRQPRKILAKCPDARSHFATCRHVRHWQSTVDCGDNGREFVWNKPPNWAIEYASKVLQTNRRSTVITIHNYFDLFTWIRKSTENFETPKFVATMAVGAIVGAFMYASGLPVTEAGVLEQLAAYAGIVVIVENILKAILRRF